MGGDRGRPALKRLLPPLKRLQKLLKKTIERTLETIAYCI